MNNEHKQRICESLRAYCGRKGSQNKAANSLNGVSSATVSKVLSGQWDTIADEMWRTIEAQTGGRADGWQVVNTRAFDTMTFTLKHAQADALVLAVTGDAGCGKTEAVRRYAAEHDNAYHLVCSEYWNRRTFMTQLLRCMGVGVSGGTVGEMMDDIVDALLSQESPLIVLDEADKLTDQVLYFFITLYNRLEGHCGIILTATPYLRKRVERGVQLSRKGYAEIYSRIGRKFVPLPLPGPEDIAAICTANGLNESSTLSAIAGEAEGDLRRVKRSVWARLKGGAQ